MKSLHSLIFIFLALCFFVPRTLHAASTTLSSEKASFSINEEFLVRVYIDTQGASLNAIEGSLSYPSTMLDLVGVRTGDSIVSIWIEQPHAGENSPATFSGIIPGGYSSPQGLIVTLVFRTKTSGQGTIRMDTVKVIENTEEGRTLAATTTPFTFTVSSLVPNQRITQAPIRDRDAPETFSAHVARDTALYDGLAFLVFATQDKGSGLDGYEVREGFWGSWEKAESPYLLRNQKLDKKIYVRAIDKNGNTRVSIAYPENIVPWYGSYAALGCIFVLIACMLWRVQTKFR